MNVYQKREVWNYLHWVARQRFSCQALRAAVSAAEHKVAARFTRDDSMPPYLHDLRAAVDPPFEKKEMEGVLPQSELCTAHPPDGGGARPGTLVLPLATAEFTFATDRLWEFLADDLEDTYALHRFGWAIQKFVEKPTQETARGILYTMADWVRQGPRDTTHPAWQSYTVSERIVHWLHLLRISRQIGAAPHADHAFILESVRAQADHLSEHLEYRGSKLTNNHLLNNGRALYCAGWMLPSPHHLQLGRRIIKEEVASRFSGSGFLMEGSSHYHVLLTRTLLELWWVAERNSDTELCRMLEHTARIAVRGVRFFLPTPQSPLPLVGDVSPDFPPDWLRDVASVITRERSDESADPSAFTLGWPAFWKTVAGPSWPAVRESVSDPEPGLTAYTDAGWYRCVESDYSVYWHAQTPGSPNETCHAHHDLGSFELHVGDYPVVVDPGRSTYEPTHDGQTWRSARSHNTVVVNGHEPCVTRGFNGHPTFLDAYTRPSLEVTWSAGGRPQEFSIRHDGYKRISGVSTWTRRFLLFADNVRVMDTLQGKGPHRIETFFHLHPEVEIRHDISDRRLILDHPKVRVHVDYTCQDLRSVDLRRMGTLEDGHPVGRFSPRYGAVVPAWSIRFLQVIQLPSESVFDFRIH